MREYVVWRVLEGAIGWFVLREGRYVPLAAGEDGVYRSEVFPALWLDVTSMLARDLRRVLEVPQQGVAGEEHAAFAAVLQAGGAIGDEERG